MRVVPLVFLLTGCTGLSVERVGAPPSSEQPFVVLLHGYGADGDDLVPLAEELAAQSPEASFMVPAAPHRGGGGRTWIPNFRKDTREEVIVELETRIDSASTKVWARINEAREAGVDCSEIVVIGFSLGGYMAAQVAVRAPEDCAIGGLVVISGGGPADAPVRATEGQSPMRVLVAHGKKDSVVPFASGKAISQTLARAGHDVSFLSFDGAHQIAPEVREALTVFLAKGRVGEVVGWQ